MENNSSLTKKQKSQFAFVSFLTFVRAPLILFGGALAILNAFKPSNILLYTALVLMIISAFTDLFDGKLARKWNVTSKFGALADPLMDKIFFAVVFPTATVIAMYIYAKTQTNEMLYQALILLAIDVIALLRDHWVTFMRVVGSDYGADVKAAFIGKLRTFMGFPIMIFVHLYLGSVQIPNTIKIGQTVPLILEIAFLAITIISTITYTKDYLPYLRMEGPKGK